MNLITISHRIHGGLTVNAHIQSIYKSLATHTLPAIWKYSNCLPNNRTLFADRNGKTVPGRPDYVEDEQNIVLPQNIESRDIDIIREISEHLAVSFHVEKIDNCFILNDISFLAPC